jgi:hypothetical protein
MLRRLLLLALVLSCWGAPGARAQDTVLWGHVGQWQIRIDKSVNYGCFMLGSYTQGTLLRIGFDQNNRNGYLLVGNDAWRSLQIGNRYELVLRFDRAAPWRGPATARTIGSGTMVFLHLTFDSPRFLLELARRATLTIYYAGNAVTRLPLRGTYAATEELLRCQRAADAGRPANTPDSFSGGGPQRPAPAPGGPAPAPGGPSFGPSAPSSTPDGPPPSPGSPSPSPGGPTFSPSGPSPGPAGPSASPDGPSGPGGPGGVSPGAPSPGPGGPTFSPSGPRSPDR